MKRIATATKAVDLFGAGKHGFKDGNKALGIAATQLDASIFNNIQEEIISIIEAAGIALNGAVYTQLLTALRSAGVFTTPAQFDATTKVATMAAVQRAIGGFQGRTGYGTAGQTIPASLVNSAINLFGTCSSITLPLLSSVPEGSTLKFVSALPCTIQRQGADEIFLNATTSLTSLGITNGGELLFVAGATSWYVSGTSALPYSSEFARDLSVAGYQKLPGGMIQQWGTALSDVAGAVTVTYPIAFPVTGKAFFQAGSSAYPVVGTTEASGSPLASVLLHGWRCDTGVRTAANFVWLAKGY